MNDIKLNTVINNRGQFLKPEGEKNANNRAGGQNTEAIKRSENIKALEWLSSYKIWDNTKGEEGWKTYNWQVCKLGGYCYNANGHEKPEPKRNWKDYEEEKGERDYKYFLLKEAGKTFRVDCDCLAVKDGDERILYYREKSRKQWTREGWFCEQHAQERAEKIKSWKDRPKYNYRVELRNDPIWDVDYKAVNARIVEMTGRDTNGKEQY